VARNSSIGLDIGTRTVHVAEVASPKGQPTVVNFGGLDLPVSTVREGEILDVPAVADAVKQIVATTGIKGRKANLGIANQRVVVRQIDLPWMDPRELRSSLRFQVQEFIPIPVEDAELDFHVLEEFQGEADTRMLRLLLVAAHKDMVATHIAAAEQAGLRPVGVDLNPFAMLRALGSESALETAGEVLIDVGAGVTNIVVHDRGVPRFVRILVLGGDDITEALASGQGTSYEDAEALKKRSGLTGAADDTARRLIDDHAAQFIDEVRSSLDYYQAQTGSGRLGRVVITGGGALLAGLGERLGTAIRLPVELGNPFDRWPVGNVEMGPEQLAQVGPVLTTAIGLALGGAE
jgi:type IV pilus assembly protein PilM